MRFFCLPIAALVLFSVLDSGVAQSQRPEEFSVQIQKKLNYLLYLPSGYKADAGPKWPFVLFLHGAGERGTDLNRITAHGPPKQAAAGQKLPFILASPQCPDGQWWESDVLMALIEDLEKSLQIDPNRIYVTGLSMGGYGTWALAMRYPDKFAAIAPICGGGIPYQTQFIDKLPIWTFHGDADTAVDISQTQILVDALKKRGSPVKFTIYPGVGHNCWEAAYGDPALYQWMLGQVRGK